MTKAELTVWNREREIPGTTILKNGWPDFLVERAGVIRGIEVKTPADRVSESQQRMHAMLKAAGIQVDVVVVPGKPGKCRDESLKAEYQSEAERLFERMFQLEKEHAEVYRRIRLILNLTDELSSKQDELKD